MLIFKKTMKIGSLANGVGIVLIYLTSIPVSGESTFTIENRTGSIRHFPCSQCHPKSLSHKNTSLPTHTGLVFKHMRDVKKCYRCHSYNSPNMLLLLDGNPLSYAQSPSLCGQCHGTKERDWTLGIHGLQKGQWNNQKIKRTCTHCHNPHAPKFPTLKAFPPPQLPEGSKQKGKTE